MLRMVTVSHTPASAGQVRRELGADLARRGVHADLVADASLLISELIGNAVRYARPLPGGVLRIAWSLRPGCLLLRVSDGGGRSAPHVRESGPSDIRGRGLAIVESLARAWGIDRYGTGLGAVSTVWAELPTR